MSRPAAVGFDLWETLLTNSEELSELQKKVRVAELAATLAEHQLVGDEASVERAHEEVWERCQSLYWSEDLDISTRRQIEHLVECLGVECMPPVLERLESVYANALLAHPPSLVEGACEVLSWIADRGIRLGLISNTGRTPGSTLRALLGDLGIDHYFQAMVFSNEVGFCKPTPAVFERLLSGLGSDASETVFIGDNLYADVGGAGELGMKTIHFDPPVRGTAFAPIAQQELRHQPWKVVRRLEEIPPLLEEGW